MRYFDHVFGRTRGSQLVLSSDLELVEVMLGCCCHCCTGAIPISTEPAAVNVLESDLGTPMNSLEVFFYSGEFLSILPMFYERLSAL